MEITCKALLEYGNGFTASCWVRKRSFEMELRTPLASIYLALVTYTNIKMGDIWNKVFFGGLPFELLILNVLQESSARSNHVFCLEIYINLLILDMATSLENKHLKPSRGGICEFHCIHYIVVFILRFKIQLSCYTMHS